MEARLQLLGQQGSAASALVPTETRPATPDAPRPLSARTVAFYARDWAAFAAWCRNTGAAPLPAEAATLAGYLTTLSARLSRRAVARHLSAIAGQHRQAGLIAPTKNPAVKTVLKAMRRGTPRAGQRPTPALLARMVAACPGDRAGLRDRSLLLIMQATRLGRAALISLDAEAIRKTTAGAELVVDDAGSPRTILLARASDRGTCPVQALDEWLLVSGTSFGPVFKKIDRWGTVEHHRLGTDAIRRILARRAPVRQKRNSSGESSVDLAEPA